MKCYLDETILQKGKTCTAGSRILENFVAPFSAAVVERLVSAGVSIAGTAAVSEFNLYPAEAVELPELLLAVRDGRCDFALCNDHSGYIRDLAARNGLCYLLPTYGAVSRYGLIAAVSSMDQAGVLAREPETAFRALEIIAGYDERDGTSLPDAAYPAPEDGPTGVLGEDFSLQYESVLAPVHAILSAAELSNNISRFDGVKFGFRAEGFRNVNELYLKTRTEGFGRDTKLALVVGAMVLSAGQYESRYHKAMQLRRLIRDELLGLLGRFAALRLPGSMTQPAALAGLPSLTTADGAQLVAGPMGEKTLEKLVKGGTAR